MSPGKFNIGIAGAGIAGLSTGIQLQQNGHSVQIFEPRSGSGGRIQSQMMNGYLVEAGPEFIHGNAKETIRLLNKYRIPYVPADGKMYRVHNGQRLEEDDLTEGWEKLLIRMKKLENDLPFGEFLLKYFPGADGQELRKSATRFAEGFDLADTKTASTQALAIEWLAGEGGQYRIPLGYQTLIRSMEQEFISSGGKILFQHPVETVDWTAKDIRVGIRDRQSFNLDKLVVTVPVPMLSPVRNDSEKLLFIPSPDEDLNLFSQIGYGTVIKLVISWNSAFWKDLVPDAQLIFSDGFIPTWWTQFPQDLPLLTGWLGGPAAEAASGEPDDFFLKRGLETLSVVFSIPVSELINKMTDFRVFNWKKETWIRGGYSYPTVKSHQAKILSRNHGKAEFILRAKHFIKGHIREQWKLPW